MTIFTPSVKAKSFTGVERKLKGREIVAILKVDENEFIAFVEECKCLIGLIQGLLLQTF